MHMHMLSENIEDNGCRKYQTGLIRRITKTERTLTHFSIADEVVRMKKSSKLFVRSLRNPFHYSIFQRRNMICTITRHGIWSWRIYCV